MLKQIESPIGAAYAEGAYDQAAVYEALEPRGKRRKPRILIPPKKGAKVSSKASLSERGRQDGGRAKRARTASGPGRSNTKRGPQDVGCAKRSPEGGAGEATRRSG